MVEKKETVPFSGARGHFSRGFTLIEMLVVMTLLVSFGYLVFSLMRGSLELWRKGESGRDLGEKAAAVFDILERDLRSMHTGPEGRLLCETGLETAGPKTQSPSRRLSLVRSVSRAEEAAAFRRLGILDGPPGVEGEPTKIVPSSGGLIEIAYAARKDARSEDPGIQVLYRGVSPRGGGEGQSFFSEGFFANAGVWGGSMKEVTSGVLYFGIAFGPESTDNWQPGDESAPTGRNDPIFCWDSTRGWLGKTADLPANRFPFAKGESSLGDPRDDLYPSYLFLTLALERDASETRLTFLRERIDETERRFEVDDPKRLPNAFPAFIKIDAEWMEISGIEGKSVAVKTRGARSSVQAAHEAGTKIHAGETFTTMIRLEHRKEDWNAR